MVPIGDINPEHQIRLAVTSSLERPMCPLFVFRVYILHAERISHGTTLLQLMIRLP